MARRVSNFTATRSPPPHRSVLCVGMSRSATKADGLSPLRSPSDRHLRVGRRNEMKGISMPERKGTKRDDPVEGELPSDANEQALLGARLKEAREYIGLLQEDVATALGI